MEITRVILTRADRVKSIINNWKSWYYFGDRSVPDGMNLSSDGWCVIESVDTGIAYRQLVAEKETLTLDRAGEILGESQFAKKTIELLACDVCNNKRKEEIYRIPTGEARASLLSRSQVQICRDCISALWSRAEIENNQDMDRAGDAIDLVIEVEYEKESND